MSKLWKIPVIMLLLLAVWQLVMVPMSAGTYPTWSTNIYIVLALIIMIFGIVAF